MFLVDKQSEIRIAQPCIGFSLSPTKRVFSVRLLTLPRFWVLYCKMANGSRLLNEFLKILLLFFNLVSSYSRSFLLINCDVNSRTSTAKFFLNSPKWSRPLRAILVFSFARQQFAFQAIF